MRVAIFRFVVQFADRADWPGPFANWPDWQIGRNIYNNLE